MNSYPKLLGTIALVVACCAPLAARAVSESRRAPLEPRRASSTATTSPTIRDHLKEATVDLRKRLDIASQRKVREVATLSAARLAEVVKHIDDTLARISARIEQAKAGGADVTTQSNTLIKAQNAARSAHQAIDAVKFSLGTLGTSTSATSTASTTPVTSEGIKYAVKTATEAVKAANAALKETFKSIQKNAAIDAN